MYSVEFDTLLHKHPDPAQQATIVRLADQIASTLRTDRNAVIDERILSQQLQANEDLIKELLTELVNLFVLQVLLLWQCPNGRGTVSEERSLDKFPLQTECECCGQLHTFQTSDVDVRFTPSPMLLQQLEGDDRFRLS